MNCLKRVISFFAVFTLLASLVACNSAAVLPTVMPTAVATATPAATATLPEATSAAPSPTEAVATASPEPEDTSEADTDEGDEDQDYEFPYSDFAKDGLTDEQFQKINLLIYGALYGDYFSNPKSLNNNSIFNFIYEVLNSSPDLLNGQDCSDNWKSNSDGDFLLDKKLIEKLVKSAFNIDYKSSYAGDREYGLTYKHGVYTFMPADGDPGPWPYIFSISRISDNQLCVQFDLFEVGGGEECSEWQHKAQAILQVDKDSLFGYHFISFTKLTGRPAFTKAAASTESLNPKYSIDGKLKTAWSTDKGAGQWLELYSDKEQMVSGLSLYVGDRARSNNEGFSSGDIDVTLEFSDGTKLDSKFDTVVSTDDYYSVSFGREIKTKYIKITIVSADDDKIYIAEVKPF